MLLSPQRDASFATRAASKMETGLLLKRAMQPTNNRHFGCIIDIVDIRIIKFLAMYFFELRDH